MRSYDRPFRNLAICFAALAGFVDALGFLVSGGLFISFMSGNSTRLAIGIVQARTTAIAAATLILLFVLGVFLGAMSSVKSVVFHRKVTTSAFVSFLLGLAAATECLGFHMLALALLCMGMGASNTIFQRNGEVSIGVTYMTGTLVKLGFRIADAVQGGDPRGWVPYFLLWLALVTGGIAGAVGFFISVPASFCFAAGSAFALTGVTYLLTTPDRQRNW